MRFVENGPDIPESLLQAHEEGKVVFFCGAGVSVPLGFPSFAGLVSKLYKRSGISPNKQQSIAISQNLYDLALSILENQHIEGKRGVRRELFKLLYRKPKKLESETHASLLDLATLSDGSVRLVTTNYDRAFEYAKNQTEKSFESYSAPFLPVPKKSRWNGIVYLHGLLPSTYDEIKLNNLVLTSGDFGAAYLTERWASRFVTELFRNYIVCFIGYSLNDSVLRYMTDAMLDDRLRGENVLPMYALVPESGETKNVKAEWEAKGIIPILYSKTGHDHGMLHLTLKKWSEQYRDGFLAKKQIITLEAQNHPSSDSQALLTDSEKRLLWAIVDKDGAGSKVFSSLDPLPPFEWIYTFSRREFSEKDLSRFGNEVSVKSNNKKRYSIFDRPMAHKYAPHMSLFQSRDFLERPDPLMDNISDWLLELAPVG